jgi:DNA-binding response OmpR family regulator
VILPGINGLDMMATLKERYDIPVVFLTTQHSDADRALAFDLGAADFVAKPFDPFELGQRLAALVGGREVEERIIDVGDLRIDLTRQLARRSGGVISLSTNEWALLLSMAKRPGEVTSTEDLMSAIWGTNNNPAQLSPLINRLRRSLEADPKNPTIILGDIENGFTLAVEDQGRE